MEQRPLRLGDIVDDYCTRERRVTNHAIVAVVENVIRQTRCTTCDAEHVYKGAKEPRLRKKPETSALYDQVLADVTGGAAAAADDRIEAAAADSDVEQAGTDAADGTADDGSQPREPGTGGEGAWTGHRRLIRATLPPSNEPPPPRPIPEFTMYQKPPARGARFRFRGHGGGHSGGQGNGIGNGNGNGPGPNGFGQSNRPGNAPGGGRPGRRRGRKRH